MMVGLLDGKRAGLSFVQNNCGLAKSNMKELLRYSVDAVKNNSEFSFKEKKNGGKKKSLLIINKVNKEGKGSNGRKDFELITFEKEGCFVLEEEIVEEWLSFFVEENLKELNEGS